MENKITDQELSALAEGVIARLKDIEKNPNWEKKDDKPCEMYRMEIESRVASKGVAIVNFSLEKIVSFLQKPDTLKKINPMLVEFKPLHAKENDFKVNYMQYEGMWPVSGRDFVNLTRQHKEGEGKVYIGTKSCNYPYPVQKGIERGEVFIGGYIIQKIDQKSSRVTYISDADLKGSIPGMIKNSLSQKQGEIASRIEGVMQKENY